MTELKPCPFCGTSDVRLLTLSHDKATKSYQVGCGGGLCWVNGPIRVKKDKAIEAWNRRA